MSKTIKPIDPSISAESWYRKTLFKLIDSIIADLTPELTELLSEYDKQFSTDSIGKETTRIFAILKKRYDRKLGAYDRIAEKLFNKIDKQNKQKFYKQVEQTLGLNYQQLKKNENLENIRSMAIAQNASLIKTIPEKYIQQVEQALYSQFSNMEKGRSLIKEFQPLIENFNGDTYKRARFIARDQTSKINADLVKYRAENAGSDEYIWRTVADERVRPTHKEKDRQTFKWSEPPEDTGHPGKDYQCRCRAIPIFPD
jgi:SPP1 gp7 family putative phage head morphogenesis protein